MDLQQFTTLLLMCISDDINDHKLAGGIIDGMYAEGISIPFTLMLYGALMSDYGKLKMHNNGNINDGKYNRNHIHDTINEKHYLYYTVGDVKLSTPTHETITKVYNELLKL